MLYGQLTSFDDPNHWVVERHQELNHHVWAQETIGVRYQNRIRVRSFEQGIVASS